MYGAYGVRVGSTSGRAFQLEFLADASPFSEDEGLDPEERELLKGFKKTFINAEILEEEGRLGLLMKAV